MWIAILLKKGCVILMYKVAVVGDKDSVLAFTPTGIEVHAVSNSQEAANKIDNLAENDYGIIFVTEHIAKDIEETLDRYIKKVTPSIILIPSSQGSLGIGLKRISDNVQKAVGMNIL